MARHPSIPLDQRVHLHSTTSVLLLLNICNVLRLLRLPNAYLLYFLLHIFFLHIMFPLQILYIRTILIAYIPILLINNPKLYLLLCIFPFLLHARTLVHGCRPWNRPSRTLDTMNTSATMTSVMTQLIQTSAPAIRLNHSLISHLVTSVSITRIGGRMTIAPSMCSHLGSVYALDHTFPMVQFTLKPLTTSSDCFAVGWASMNSHIPAHCSSLCSHSPVIQIESSNSSTNGARSSLSWFLLATTSQSTT